MCTRIKITSRNLHMRVTIKVAKKKKGATVTFSEYRTVSDLFIDKFDGHNGIIVHINTLRARRTFHGFQNMILFSVLKCIVWTSQAIIDSLCNVEKENWNEKKMLGAVSSKLFSSQFFQIIWLCKKSVLIWQVIVSSLGFFFVKLFTNQTRQPTQSEISLTNLNLIK